MTVSCNRYAVCMSVGLPMTITGFGQDLKSLKAATRTQVHSKKSSLISKSSNIQVLDNLLSVYDVHTRPWNDCYGTKSTLHCISQTHTGPFVKLFLGNKPPPFWE